MAESAVVNASPLIFLTRGGRLDLLHHFANHILVPEPVAHEIQSRGPQDVTAKAIHDVSWIETISAPQVPEMIMEWGLGAGESSVLAFAHQHAGMEAIVDDLSARKCAASLGIPVRGTLGIVLVAKRRGLIPSARAAIEDLIRAGLYLSRPLLDDALKKVGE